MPLTGGYKCDVYCVHRTPDTISLCAWEMSSLLKVTNAPRWLSVNGTIANFFPDEGVPLVEVHSKSQLSDNEIPFEKCGTGGRRGKGCVT